MFVDIVISNVFNLNKKKLFLFLFIFLNISIVLCTETWLSDETTYMYNISCYTSLSVCEIVLGGWLWGQLTPFS